MRKGSLHVICGCMFSGKSRELHRQLERARYAKIPVFAFKPLTDTRSDAIVSRTGASVDAIGIATVMEIVSHLPSTGPGIVGIDEIQFFPEHGTTPIVELLIARGFEFVCAGLDTDFRGMPFGPLPHLLAVADVVTKLTAVCVKCGDRHATRSQRLANGVPASFHDPTIRMDVPMVGTYEARCRSCHEVPGSMPAP